MEKLQIIFIGRIVYAEKSKICKHWIDESKKAYMNADEKELTKKC